MQAGHESGVKSLSVNEVLKSAVQPIVAVCVPDMYTGTESEYCTFNYTELPDEFGDDQPWLIRYSVQLHWFLPAKVNPLERKRQLRQAMIAAGFTAPTVTPASDDDGQHYVFECEWLGGL